MNTDTTEVTEAVESSNPLAAISTLAMPNISALAISGRSALEFAQSFEILDQDDYDLAASELSDVKGRQKRLDTSRRSITDPIRAAADAVMKLFAPATALLADTEAAWKGKMLVYVDAERAKARELERLARIEQDAQRAAQAAIAEQARKAAQALADEAALTGSAEAEDRAMEASATAASLAAQANVIAAPAAAAPAHKTTGTSVRTSYEFEVQSLLALVQHIATKQPELIGLLSFDNIKMRAYVKGLGANTSLPGVRIFEKTTLASKAN